MTTPQEEQGDGGQPPAPPAEESSMQEAPPPLPLDGWHYSLAGSREGPVTADRVGELLAAGNLTGDTMVWRQGWKEWRPLSQTDLAARHPGGAVPPPVEPPGEATPTGAAGFLHAFWKFGSKSPVVQWGKVGGVLGALVGSYYYLTERFFGFEDFIIYPILGCAAGVFIRKWIFRTFWT